MADAIRRPFAFNELTGLLAALEAIGQPCVLVGGQAVCYWAQRYLPEEPALQEMSRLSGFVSKDVDFQGGLDAARAFARAMGCKLQAPSFRDAFGNVLSGKFSLSVKDASLTVEVLRKVPGLELNEVTKLASVEAFGNFTLRVLNPIALLKAKAWNVVHIIKEDRHDVDQLLVLLVCACRYLKSLLVYSGTDRRKLRGALKLIEQALRFTELPAGRKAAEKCGVEWSQILPHAYLTASVQPELIRLREKRIPDWLAHLVGYKRGVPAVNAQRRMLEILALHAEPWCARPAGAGRASRFASHLSRRP